MPASSRPRSSSEIRASPRLVFSSLLRHQGQGKPEFLPHAVALGPEAPDRFLEGGGEDAGLLATAFEFDDLDLALPCGVLQFGNATGGPLEIAERLFLVPRNRLEFLAQLPERRLSLLEPGGKAFDFRMGGLEGLLDGRNPPVGSVEFGLTTLQLGLQLDRLGFKMLRVARMLLRLDPDPVQSR